MDQKLDNILSKIASDASIKLPKIVCTYQTGKGEGYMGRVKMLEITETENNGTNQKKMYIIVKQSPLGDEMRARMPVGKIFETEIIFYSKIAPALNDFQSSYSAHCYDFIKCFYTDGTVPDEMLIIENLSPKGYGMLNGTVFLKFDHMKLAFEELAKLHSLSYALKTLKPKVFEKLAEPLAGNIFFELYNVMHFDTYIEKVTADFKEMFIGTPYNDIFCEFRERIMDEFNRSNEPDKYSVICHGDSWSNNILYSHDPTGKPTSAVLIDFQLSRVLSPVSDLTYLFYGCCDVELLPRLKELLQMYHSKLAECLKKFGLDIEQVFPWRVLMEHWRTFGKQGFITSFLMRVLTMSDSDESADLTVAAKQGDDLMLAAYYYKMKRDDEYREIIGAIVRHFIDEKFIY